MSRSHVRAHARSRFHLPASVVAAVVAAAVAVPLAVATLPVAAAAQEPYRTPPPELAALVDAPLAPAAEVSPDGSTLLLLERASHPSIDELARDELRLAGTRIDPARNGPSRTRPFAGLAFVDLAGDGAERGVAGLPAGAAVRNPAFSPDGSTVAFTVDRADRVELWVATVADARARRVTPRAVNDVLSGRPFDWLPDGSGVVARLVPGERGAPPEAPAVPPGPVIQETGGAEAPARTYQDLLENPHDEALFEHYATAEVARVGLDGSVRRLAGPALVAGASVSPDGRYVLVESLERPFSYLVPWYRFPERVEVVSAADGSPVATVAELPLREEVPAGFGSVPGGMRSVEWRADAPATLAWVEALDGGDARADADLRDRVFLLEAPFRGEPEPLLDLSLRYAGVDWGTDEVALVHERWWYDRTARTHVVSPGSPGAPARVLFDYSYEDRYADPGDPVLVDTESGTRVLALADGGEAAFFMGDGASPEGERPFLRKVDLSDGSTGELFRSSGPWYEEPVALLDAGARRVLTTRESPTEPPNYFVRDLAADRVARVTDFPHPYPELRDVGKEFITYRRDDGVQLTATLYLPAGYDSADQGPLPGFVWAYPREFKSADAAGQVTDSPYRFSRVSYWGAVPWVTRGYAVIDGAAMPVIGEGDEEPNDTYVEQLVSSARAAIDEGVRRGVLDPDRVAIGGHSYGAFMTANLLAHSDLFRAGIARSGAYNRTLTPFGFQAEQRLFWEAPEVYFAMSPFMHADDVDEPILLIHGIADNNSGTFPVQSERFYHALKGLGATARLVMLPHESHGYRSRESLLHMLWEMDRWLETYVKNAPPGRAVSEAEPGGEGP